MKQAKIAIIGTGSVGSTVAYSLITRSISAEIMLVDINKEKCKGEVLDLSDSLSFSDTYKVREATISETKNCDIIIICAGIAQKPGQERTDLVKTNKKIVSSIIDDLKPIGKNTIIICVTNPVDAITFFALKESELPHNRIFGTGTLLDTIRIKGLISEKLQISEQSIYGYILGEHGQSQVPVWSNTRIAGIPILDYPNITKKELDEFSEKTKQKANEIIKCKGATFFGIASCVSTICKSILLNQKLILPLSVFIEKFGICISMPAILGSNGIEKIIEAKLDENESKQLQKSAEVIKKTIDI